MPTGCREYSLRGGGCSFFGAGLDEALDETLELPSESSPESLRGARGFETAGAFFTREVAEELPFFNQGSVLGILSSGEDGLHRQVS